MNHLQTYSKFHQSHEHPESSPCQGFRAATPISHHHRHNRQPIQPVRQIHRIAAAHDHEIHEQNEAGHAERNDQMFEKRHDEFGMRRQRGVIPQIDTDRQRDLAIGQGAIAAVLAQQGDAPRALDLLQQARAITAAIKKGHCLGDKQKFWLHAKVLTSAWFEKAAL